MTLYCVLDCESVGLHGETYAYGYALVTEGGETLESGYGACSSILAEGTPEDRTWIEKNIDPNLPEPTVKSPREVRSSFWKMWSRHKNNGVILAADCPWPVEARFLLDCVRDDPTRTPDGPYPLIDVSSVLLASGKDPLGDYKRLEDELPVHNPLADAKQSARLFIEALDVLKKRKTVLESLLE
jgi:hypothetical protein